MSETQDKKLNTELQSHLEESLNRKIRSKRFSPVFDYQASITEYLSKYGVDWAQLNDPTRYLIKDGIELSMLEPDTPISLLFPKYIGVRLLNSLLDGGAPKIADVQLMSEKDLRKVRNAGRKTLDQFIEFKNSISLIN